MNRRQLAAFAADALAPATAEVAADALAPATAEVAADALAPAPPRTPATTAEAAVATDARARAPRSGLGAKVRRRFPRPLPVGFRATVVPSSRSWPPLRQKVISWRDM
jgi:hypothetical protein